MLERSAVAPPLSQVPAHVKCPVARAQNGLTITMTTITTSASVGTSFTSR